MVVEQVTIRLTKIYEIVDRIALGIYLHLKRVTQQPGIVQQLAEGSPFRGQRNTVDVRNDELSNFECNPGTTVRRHMMKICRDISTQVCEQDRKAARVLLQKICEIDDPIV